MKRILSLALSLFLVLCLLTALSLSAFSTNLGFAPGEKPLVVDNAGLLSEGERQALEQKAQSISNAHGCEVILVTVNGTDGKTAQDYAEDFYYNNGYGFGQDRSGVLLLVDMLGRDYQLEATGMAEGIFNDEESEYLFSKFVPALSEGRYAEAFNAYFDFSEKMIGVYDGSLPEDEANAINEDFDNYTNPTEVRKPNYVRKGIFSVILGALGGFLPVGAQKSALKTVRKRRDAAGYAKQGSLNLTMNRDTYLYSSVTSHVIQPQRTESNGGGVHTIGSGHSSTHVHSSGTSFNSHGGKF